MPQRKLKLNGFTFQELFTSSGLKRLDETFLTYLKKVDKLLYDQLLDFRNGQSLTPEAVSGLLLECAPILEAFIAELFNIEEMVGRMQAKTIAHNPIFAFKKYYVLRQARRALNRTSDNLNFNELNQWLNTQLKQLSLKNLKDDRELTIAHFGQRLLEDPIVNQTYIEKLTDWCVAAMSTLEGQVHVQGWQSFKFPKKLNYANLVSVYPVNQDPWGRLHGPIETRHHREGFQLTDPRMSLREVMNEIHYCVYCHKTDGDFCSKGFPVKKTDPTQGLKINPVGEALTGCPLEEKISEMHVMKKEGYGIAALAMITIDNPMCPATGHRICNDCMKACIFQKQDPVNIPQTETRILTDVLHLPWGVEIYDLLVRWNPLRPRQWIPKEYNGLKILIMGMGPAGFTLAHHMLMEGFAVVGTEGLKIEPLPKHLIQEPIYSYQELMEDLNNRVMAGFGGVAEYGITVRWDKNFLKLIYISLMRRPYFQIFGSIRFGGTLMVNDAWRLGFDHLTVAVGAGLPRELSIPHSMAPGMRQANDFLMALQLTGAAKKSSMANLQVRLPTVVIGGGLTGIDTATEVQAYYITQIEKIHERYHKVVKHFGETTVRKKFDTYSLKILDEFLTHAQEVLAERVRAKQEQQSPNLNQLIRRWGGVTIAYRRTMQESPAYRRNHEEVINALNEGIFYAEGLEPKSVVLDEHGHVSALRCRWRVMDEEGNWMFTDEEQVLPARSIFVATGAKPNIAYEFEHRSTFQRQGFNYQRHELTNAQLVPVNSFGHAKIDHFGPFTSYQDSHRRVTFIGDTHPIFHGSVVKAIASAKRTYPKIVEILIDNTKIGDETEYQEFRRQMEVLFRAKVVAIKRHTKDVVEIKIRAPMAAQNFRPGQFYRLQNYECLAKTIGETRLQTEALALMGVHRPQEPDILSLFVLEEGASSRLVSTFQKGDHVSLMGPTGARCKVSEEKQTIMLIGGALAAVHLLSHGPALRKMGHRVLYVGYFNSVDDIFCQDEIEAATDSIYWVMRDGKSAPARRSQDLNTSEDIIMALREYALKGNEVAIPLSDIQRVMIIGSTRLIRTLDKARSALLKEFFAPNVVLAASVYGPMQCMLKGVCAQCLQWQVDPLTGKRTKAIYACSWQNQPLNMIDIDNIDERLNQNKMQETLANLWLDYLFEKHEVGRV